MKVFAAPHAGIRWWATRVTQPLATLAFAGGVVLAWRHFPAPFDWHRVVISALQSPRDNPLGYEWLAFGLAVSGLFLFPLAHHLAGALAPFTMRGARWVRALLLLGIVAMELVALFTHRPALYPRLHENLALVSYFSLSLALLITAVLLLRHPAATVLAARRHHPWLLPLLAVIPIAPLVAAGLSQLLLFLAPTLAAGATAPYLQLAFWQWILSTLLYVNAWLLAWLAGDPRG